MARSSNKRSRYLVDKKLQFAFVGWFALFAAVPIVLMVAALYVVNTIYLSRMQIIVGNAILNAPEIREVLTLSLFAIAELFILMLILSAFIGIKFSHQIVGPLVKVHATLDRLIRGERVEPIRFRKDDALIGLDEKLNRLIKKVSA